MVKDIIMSRSKVRKNNKSIDKCENTKGQNMITIISLILSVFSLGVAFYAGYNQYVYYNAEYVYKVSPKFTVTGQPKANAKIKDGERINEVSIKSFNIKINEINNLDKIVILNADGSLYFYTDESNDIEDEVSKKLVKEFELNKNDIDTGAYKYKYKFIVLKELDSDINIYVVGCKFKEFKPSDTGICQLFCYGLEEMYSFDNKNLIDSENEGEYTIAQKYKEIVKWYKEHKIQLILHKARNTLINFNNMLELKYKFKKETPWTS